MGVIKSQQKKSLGRRSRYKKWYWIGIAAAALPVLFAFILFYPGFGGSAPLPPQTISSDVVVTGADFQGQLQGAAQIGGGPGGAQVLALDAARPEKEGGYTSEPVKADFPFNALGLHWLDETPPGSQIAAEVRLSGDGVLWEDWQPLAIRDDDIPDHIASTKSAGETITELVYAQGPALYFQYRLHFTGNTAGESPSISRLTASYIDAKGYHEPSLSLSALANRVSAFIRPPRADAQVGIISRAQWGANDDYTRANWPPDYADPKKEIVHHTVTQNWDPDPAATVRSIWQYHAVSLGWGDIGYNYLIDWHGNIYEGRYGGNGVIGGHAYGWNTGTVGISALGSYDQVNITGEMYNAFVALMRTKSNENHINPNGADPFNGTNLPNYLGHRDVGSTGCPGNFLYQYLPSFRAAAANGYDPTPHINNFGPVNDNETSNSRPLISADITGVGINASAISVLLEGPNGSQDVSGQATRTPTYVSYRPPQPLTGGTYRVTISVPNIWGDTASQPWYFNVSDGSSTPRFTPRDYYWSWYDGISSRNWVLMANPSGNTKFFDLYIGGRNMSLAPFAPTNTPGLVGSAVVQPGQTVTPKYSGIMGGPVVVPSITGEKAIVSQRILWGANSFEEVPGTEYNDLSNHYFWTWYDQVSPGFRNWVLVANPNSAPVSYQVKIRGSVVSGGTIGPGASATPSFPGTMGGPVEVIASDKVIASQRVLSNGGDAFNEVSGIPAEKLGNHYLWTWYDMTGGARNWVLIANPGVDRNGASQSTVTAYVKIGNSTYGPYSIAPGANVTPTFPGVMGGPVEVYTDSGDVIASQRSIWGPSFEEVSGLRTDDLNSSYVWTWYDQASAGSTNWVLVANPNTCPVYYELKIGNSVVRTGTVPAGGNATPTIPGAMGGPVEVRAWSDSNKTAAANIMASQRVLWNGYFNELKGSVLESLPGAPIQCAGAATVMSDSPFEVREGSGALLTSLAAGQTATVTRDQSGVYYVQTSTGYHHTGSSHIRMSSPSGGVMQVTSYHDIPSWNQSLDDNKFRGAIEVRYSQFSNKLWVVNELPLEDYLKGIAESSASNPAEHLKTMSVAARTYALWHLERGGKYGASEIFHLKNSRNGNGDDQQYKGYGLGSRFPELAAAVGGTSGQVVTYNGSPAITPYFSNDDGRTRSAAELGWSTDWYWLQSVPDPDDAGMTMAGHGVGLSGHGSLARAGRGDSYQSILTYYYTGTAVQPGNTNRNIRIAIAPLG